MKAAGRHILYFFLVICVSDFYSQSATTRSAKFLAQKDIFGINVFQENRGQYKQLPGNHAKILYALDNGNDKIYFTEKGLIHVLQKDFPLTEEEREEQEEGKNVKQKESLVEFIDMSWIGANYGSIVLEASQKQSHYITYGTKEFNAYTFGKLTYKNVYDNIDIEYTIPDDKESGFKYSIIAHPGADLSKVKILYEGNINKIKVKGGDAVIKTDLGNIIEHAPKTFYTDNTALNSEFKLLKDTLSFIFPEGVQPNREIIIDPWVTTVTTLTTSNSAYDVDYDFSGNTYIYGGSIPGPFKIAMYNSTGILQWTFSGSIPMAWTNAGSYVSNFGVDRFAGKCFTGQGFVSTGAQVVRIDNAGNYDNFMSIANGAYLEVWEFSFDCSTSSVLVFGGSTSSNLSAATINTLTAVLNTSGFQPLISTFQQDVVSATQDALGNIFVIYASNPSTVNNKICRVNSTFNGNLWTQPTGFTSMTEAGNKSQYIPSAGNSNGFNCLAVNGNYVFYYDGLNLAAYSKATGANIGSTTISGATLKRQGGIAVDECNNIYLGGIGSVYTYSFNGVSFNAQSSIALGTTVTSQYVYDIKLNLVTKMLYVCGSGFVGVYSAIPSNSCSPPYSPCSFNQMGINANTSSITCATLGSATVVANGLGPYSYTWAPGSQTGAVNSGLAPGTYTVVVNDAGYNVTYTTTTTFISPTPLAGNLAHTAILPCYGNVTGTANVTGITGGSGNQFYNWTNGVNSYTAPYMTNMGPGNWSVTVTDALTGCTINNTFVIASPPQMSLFILTNTTSACVGGTINLTGFASGGSSVFNYSWSPGPNTSGNSVSQTVGGTYIYTVTAWDTNSCTVTQTIPLVFVANPNLITTSSFICPLQTGTVSVVGATSYTWNGVTTGTAYVDNPLITTTYSVVGSISGCTSAATASIILKSVPIPTLLTNSPLCNGDVLSLNGLGGSSYVWTGPTVFSSNLQNPNINPVSLINIGVYNLTVTAANSCTASTTTNVLVYPTPSLTAAGTTVCIGQTLSATANSAAGATFLWLGPSSYTSGSQNISIPSSSLVNTGAYSVTATSVNGCTISTIVNANVVPLPVPFMSLSTSTLCAQAFNGSPNSVVLTVSGANTYTIIAPNYISNSNPSGPVSTLTSAPPFIVGPVTASLIGSNGICSSSTTINFSVIPNPTVTLNSYAPVICVGQSFTYVSAGASSYTWYLGNLVVPTFTSANTVIASPTLSSIYSIVGYSMGCAGTTQNSNLTVNPLPLFTINPNPALVCIGSSVLLNITGNGTTYTWSPNLYLSTNTGTLVSASPPVVNNYIYQVIASLNSCTISSNITVSVMPLPIPLALAPQTVFCMNESVILNGSGGWAYAWNGPDNYHALGQNVSFNAGSASYSGIYTLTVSDLNNCKAVTTLSITVYALPEGYFNSEELKGCAPYCADLKFKPGLTTASITTMNWQIDHQVFTGNNIKYCFNSPGDYFISGDFTDVNNCANTYTAMVNVYSKPLADFSFYPEKPVENVDKVIFTNTSTGDNLKQWSWYFINNAGFKSKYENTSYLFPEAGVYPVAMIVTNGWGCADSVVKTITVEEDFYIYVPSAFTPNADDLNETFIPVMRGVKIYEIMIFNRWGTMIFKSNDAQKGWDGYYKGALCKEDTYIYRIYISAPNGKEKRLTGHITLYR